jgi:hypothetical protein
MLVLIYLNVGFHLSSSGIEALQISSDMICGWLPRNLSNELPVTEKLAK